MTRFVVRDKWLMFHGKWSYKFFTIIAYRIENKKISSEVYNLYGNAN